MSGRLIWKVKRTWAQFKPEIDRISGWLSQFPASVSFRLLPPASAGVRFRSFPTCQAHGDVSVEPDDVGGAYLKNSIGPGRTLRPKSTDSRMGSPNFLLPSVSVCFCQLPTGPASGRFNPVCLMATSLWVLMMSGGHIRKLNRPRGEFTLKIDRFNRRFAQFPASVSCCWGLHQVVSDLSGS